MVNNVTEIKDKFSVVVPVLNAKEHLRVCLGSILIAMHRYANAELIVLDNGSDDGSYEILLKEYSQRANIQQIHGVSVSELRNRGAALAEGEFLAFVDSDCLIVPDYFEHALHILRTYADAAGSQPVLEDDSRNWIERTWHSVHMTYRDEFVKSISAGNLVIKRQVFLAIGGFDKTMISCEDDDLGLRLNKLGFKVYQARALRSVHAGADENLREFFFKSAWRSMGMFRMLKHGWINKPVLVTFVHLALCIVAVANLASHGSVLTRLLVCAVLVNLAPAVTVLYRMLRAKRSLDAPFKLAVLYHIFFIARAYAMGKMIISLGASPERKIALSERLHNSAKTPQ